MVAMAEPAGKVADEGVGGWRAVGHAGRVRKLPIRMKIGTHPQAVSLRLVVLLGLGHGEMRRRVPVCMHA